MREEAHHGTCLLLGRRAVFLRGRPGAGKSRLALRLLGGTPKTGYEFRKLVADDRVLIEPRHGRLIARAPENLAGFLEIRGVGISRIPFEAQAQIGLVVDLFDLSERADPVPRLPEPGDLKTELNGVELANLRLASNDPAICDIIGFAMERAGNHVENVWRGLAETDELVLSNKGKSAHHR